MADPTQCDTFAAQCECCDRWVDGGVVEPEQGGTVCYRCAYELTCAQVQVLRRQQAGTDVWRCPVHGIIESPSWHDDTVPEDCGWYCPINLSGRDGNDGITDEVCSKDVTGPFRVAG